MDRISFSNYQDGDLIHTIFTNTDVLISFHPKSIFPHQDSKFNKLFDHIFSCPDVYIHELMTSAKGDFPLVVEFLGLLYKENAISYWIPEFSCLYEQAQVDTLYVLSPDGRNLFFHNFQENVDGVEPVSPFLVSGMFSAISSFIKETTRSTDLLRLIVGKK